MGAETKITISLPTDLVADLEAAVAAGDFTSLDAAIREALEEVESIRRIDNADPVRLAALIQEGVDSGPDLDGEQVFAEILADLEAEAVRRGE